MLLNLEKPPEKHQPTDDDPITRMERPREIILKIGQLKRHHEASSSRSNKKKKKRRKTERKTKQMDGQREGGGRRKVWRGTYRSRVVHQSRRVPGDRWTPGSMERPHNWENSAGLLVGRTHGHLSCRDRPGIDGSPRFELTPVKSCVDRRHGKSDPIPHRSIPDTIFLLLRGRFTSWLENR